MNSKVDVSQEAGWLEATLSSMADAVITADPNGVLTLMNRHAEALTGWKARYAVGAPVAQVVQIVDRDDAAILPEVIEQVLGEQEEVHLYDQKLNTRQGQTPVEGSVAPIRDSAGKVLGVVLVLRDVSAREQADRMLLRHVEELETRNEELETFAHTLAHDLKDQLSLIIGFSELLETEAATMSLEDLQISVAAIVNNGKKMNAIIEGLLLLAQVQRLKVTPEPVSMKQIVHEAMSRLENMIERYEAEVILPGSWPRVLGFAPWLEEVWVNYMTNALKYGGRPPRLELGAEVEADGWVRFWVRDNGRGISPEAQEKLFVPFTQLATLDIEGHGLGLSIVQGIVQKLGGKVSVQSEEGRGSTFSFSLPEVPARKPMQHKIHQTENPEAVQEACIRAA